MVKGDGGTPGVELLPRKSGVATLNVQLDIGNLAEPLVRTFRVEYDKATAVIKSRCEEESRRGSEYRGMVGPILRKDAERHYKPKVPGLLKAFIPFGVVVVAEVTFTHSWSADAYDGKKLYKARITVGHKRNPEVNDNSTVSAVLECFLKLPADVVKFCRQADLHQESEQIFRREWESRKKLRRQAMEDVRAEAEECITLDQLSKSAEGRELQDKLDEASETIVATVRDSLKAIEAEAKARRITKKK